MGDEIRRFRKRYPEIQSHINLVSDMELFDKKLESMRMDLEDFDILLNN